MHFSWPIFTVMLLLGIMQLAVGVVLGRCLPITRRARPKRPKPCAESADQHRLRFFADRLCQLVTGVAGEMGDHRSAINELNDELASVQQDDAPTLTEFVLRSVARMMAINERLQARLSNAEQRLQDQTQQIEAHFTEARTDPLTGLMNRRAFDDALEFQVAEREQAGMPFGLIMIDVDHFKNLNDEYGHPAGDDVLCRIASRLKTLLAGVGLVARFGGEEFAVIVPDGNGEHTMQIAQRIRLVVAAEPFHYEKTTMSLSVSLGVTMAGEGDDAFTVVKRADEALYTAKRSGRNCAFFHDGATCRRIELEAGAIDISKILAESTGAQKKVQPESRPGTLPTEESIEQISTELRRRMEEMVLEG